MSRHVPARKRIGLVAHDNKKQDLIEWASFNKRELVRHDLLATGTTGALLERHLDVEIDKLQSGPLGGDLMIGGLIADSAVDLLVFFWDPLQSQAHDPDVKALLRVAMVWNVPVACNRATADFLVSSPLMARGYARAVPEYAEDVARRAPG